MALPPGFGRLATKPLPTGSAASTKTTGMVWVCCSITLAAGVLLVRITSGASAASSFADLVVNSASALVQRMSMARLRPSAHPSLPSSSRNAAIPAWASGSLSSELVRMPIRRVRRCCCARAPSGYAAAVPSRDMN